MQGQSDNIYTFGDFLLDPAERRLLRSGEPVPLTPKVFELLLALVERRGHVVEKEQLMQLLWPDQYVEESNLKQSVSVLRKAMGDSRANPQYVETMPKVGYRFIAPVNKPEGKAQAELGMGVITAETGGERRPESRPSRRRQAVVLALVLFCLLVAGLSLAAYNTRKHHNHAPTFQHIKVTRLTNGGAWGPVISPDGKFVAHAANDANRQDSIWIRETSTGNSMQLVPADGAGYGPTVFSRDGSYLYYGRIDLNNVNPYWQSDVYRIPVLGGTPHKVLSNAGGVFPSPDDKQLVTLRADPAAQETKLYIANADGTGERVVSARKWPDIAWAPSWSPDGKLLTYSARNHEGDQFYNTVMAVPVGGGPERPLTSARWIHVWVATWLPDGSGLLLTAREHFGDPDQIYYVSFPGGEVRKVTNDEHSYSPLSVTADSKTLVTEVPELISNIWVAPEGDAARARQITYGGKDGLGGLAWTPDGRLVFATISRDSYTETGATGDGSIWIIDADGQNRRRLTDNDGINSDPAVTPNGRYLVFSSYRDGEWGIWRMNMDGSDPRQLAGGGGDPMTTPYSSPDGQWVVFKRGPLQATTLCRVSIDGGEVVELTDKAAYPPSISPDGNLVSFFAAKEKTNELVLIPSAGGAPVKTFDVSPNSRFLLFTMITRWAGDGRLLTYIDNEREVANIWGLPVRGGLPRRLTNFNTDDIFSFDWSHDGRRLVVARGQLSHVIVLLSDTQ